MKVKLIAVGTKMPAWVLEGFHEYERRMPAEMRLQLIEVPLANRGKNADIPRSIKKEGTLMLAHVKPSDQVIALEVEGASWSTEKLADQLKNWQMSAADVALLVGGPDGLSEACRHRANQQWSLSPLTLPHPIVRVLLAEQVYRAWTINQHHPYHRSS
jgi:23S rRNA (pseudouridine1915-N3)-methyltransferase